MLLVGLAGCGGGGAPGAPEADSALAPEMTSEAVGAGGMPVAAPGALRDSRFLPGPVERVNASTAGDQVDPHVAALADGGHVVVWTRWAMDSNGLAGSVIFAQRYDEAGHKAGSELPIHEGATADAVTGLPDGAFAMAMSSRAGNVGSLLTRRFDASGAPSGPAQTVLTAGTPDYLLLAKGDDIDALPNGDYLVTGRISNPRPPPYEDHYVRRFHASGEPMGEPILLSEPTGTPALPASTAALPNGGWVSAWQEFFGPYAPRPQNNVQSFAKVFSGAGVPVASTNVNPNADADEADPNTATLKDGHYVIAWAVGAFDAVSTLPGIQLQLFDQNGSAASAIVGLDTPEVTGGPQVTPLADGGFLLSFATAPPAGEDASLVTILGRYFNAAAQATGPMFELATARRPSASPKSEAFTWSLAPTTTGGFVITTELPGATTGEDIFLRRFDPSRMP